MIGPPDHPIVSYGLGCTLLDISEGLYHTLKWYVAGLLRSVSDDDDYDDADERNARDDVMALVMITMICIMML